MFVCVCNYVTSCRFLTANLQKKTKIPKPQPQKFTFSSYLCTPNHYFFGTDRHKQPSAMKKFLLLAAAAVMAAMNAQAQRLQVLDTEGNPVPYASVLDSKAEYIGITDLEGVLSDLKGAKDIVITHVAFKTKNVKPDGRDMVITLEDADFDMPEITVQPKPYIYVQTYYRMFFSSSEDGMYYYRAGMTDSSYDIAAKTVSGNTNVTTKAKYAILKTVFGMFGSMMDRYSQISPKSFEERMKERGKDAKVTFTQVAPGKQVISDYKGTIGSVTDDMQDHLRRYSYDSHQLFTHNLEASGKDKKLRKKMDRAERKMNREESDYYLYRIDDKGNYGPEDLVMFQNITSWDREDEGKTEHITIGMQVFTTQRAYVTKEELKQRKKDNKMKMNYANIRQFEHDHNIPALAPALQQKLDELWKSGD